VFDLGGLKFRLDTLVLVVALDSVGMDLAVTLELGGLDLVVALGFGSLGFRLQTIALDSVGMDLTVTLELGGLGFRLQTIALDSVGMDLTVTLELGGLNLHLDALVFDPVCMRQCSDALVLGLLDPEFLLTIPELLIETINLDFGQVEMLLGTLVLIVALRIFATEFGLVLTTELYRNLDSPAL
jgi:hypothetical protein